MNNTDKQAEPATYTEPDWKVVRRKFYHSQWGTSKLLEARNGGLVTDEGEAWHYEYTSKDGTGGSYDLLFRREPYTRYPPMETTMNAREALNSAVTALEKMGFVILSSSEVEVLKRIRDTAMEHTLVSRIPECGVFGGIAQDADWLLSEVARHSAPREANDKEIAELRKALEQIEQQLDYGQINMALQITRRALGGKE